VRSAKGLSHIPRSIGLRPARLQRNADDLGCQIVRVYKDHGISGAKGRDKRATSKPKAAPDEAASANGRDATPVAVNRMTNKISSWEPDSSGILGRTSEGTDAVAV
jgi:hypothetical protein